MHDAVPKLEKPGSGLPFFEWLIAKYWVLNRMPYRMSWDDTQNLFDREGQKAIQIFESIPHVLREKKVLIERIQGIEDSSRYWSAAMALEHLVIVGAFMTDGIVMISRGTSFQPTVGIADVKPLGSITSEQALSVFKDFIASSALRMAAEVQDRDSKTCVKHPWFGGMDARQWHWLMGAHQRIHRKQLEAIREKLTKIV